MPANTQSPEARVEAIEAEEAQLAGQLAEAQRSVRAAEQRLHAIDERTAAIASRSFSGDAEAQQEVEDIEEEAVRLTRSLKVARAAAEDFGRMLKEAKGRLREAELQVHQERVAELSRQRAALDPERDELAKRLFEVLDQQSRLHADAGQELRHAGRGDEANSMYVNGDGTREWLESTFSQWLR